MCPGLGCQEEAHSSLSQSWGRKTSSLLCSTGDCLKAREWLCLVGLFYGVNLESLLMATSPLSILYIMQRRMSFLLFSRLRQLRVLNMFGFRFLL